MRNAYGGRWREYKTSNILLNESINSSNAIKTKLIDQLIAIVQNDLRKSGCIIWKSKLIWLRNTTHTHAQARACTFIYTTRRGEKKGFDSRLRRRKILAFDLVSSLCGSSYLVYLYFSFPARQSWISSRPFPLDFFFLSPKLQFNSYFRFSFSRFSLFLCAVFKELKLSFPF